MREPWCHPAGSALLIALRSARSGPNARPTSRRRRAPVVEPVYGPGVLAVDVVAIPVRFAADPSMLACGAACRHASVDSFVDKATVYSGWLIGSPGPRGRTTRVAEAPAVLKGSPRDARSATMGA